MVTTKDSVKTAVENLRLAQEAEEAAQARVEEARAQTKLAKDGVAKVFLDLYNALPTDARNKVRHAINTSANMVSDDAPHQRLAESQKT